MYLEEFYNKRLKIDSKITSAEIATAEIARIQTQACMLLVAIEMPRRIGSDATKAELALEKRRCRRVLWVLKQQLAAWAEKDDKNIEWRPINDQDRQDGAALLWDKWWAAHRKYLDQRRSWIATWGLKKPDPDFANKAVNRINQELQHMEYALR
jgi:hypothetical protein